MLSWAAVAHASGSGWVQAVGALAAGILAVGLCWPAFAARRLEVTCVSSPRDATSGEQLDVVLEGNSSMRLTPLVPSGPPVHLGRSGPAEIRLLPPYRGSLEAVRVRLSTAAPLGLLWWSVEREVNLDSAVLVAPRPSGPAWAGQGGEDRDAGSGRQRVALLGDIRQVRRYRQGDSRRRVHWTATAHAGTLMVRESEEQPSRPVVVQADLAGEPEATEERASMALGAVKAHLAGGGGVVLVTNEEGRQVSGAVADVAAAGRRLARAGDNPYEDLRALGHRRSRGAPPGGAPPARAV
ncbi:MAG: DUF58 domain-containing protein [Acidimicrobiales bacterium]